MCRPSCFKVPWFSRPSILPFPGLSLGNSLGGSTFEGMGVIAITRNESTMAMSSASHGDRSGEWAGIPEPRQEPGRTGGAR